MQDLVYFAYGSNMSTRRLTRRVPSARVIGVGVLSGHRLAWHKKGRDGSGKCDIPAAAPDDVVYGVLYHIATMHRPRLDRFEGLGWGYRLKHVDVALMEREKTLNAFTYQAVRVDATYIPYDWYRDHVLIGAREHGLPDTYIRLIENVPAFEDSNPVRARSERQVHDQD